jgi:serine phosphatase RsbU (regulator of sigma subunit)
MKLLVAEHDPEKMRKLSELLQHHGHEVIRATSCRAVLAQLRSHRTDLVLMDVGLSGEGGYACTRNICALANDRFIPVLLTVAEGGRITLEDFLESGAIDFVDDAIDPHLLLAKLSGYERMRDIYAEIERHQHRIHHEVQLAKHMFETFIGRSPADIPAINHWILAAGHFSGDLLVYERTPANELHILMGDFTGHGLTAAIGALPTTDIFFSMSQKGCGIGEIAAEINRKLYSLLPTGKFCAAILARFSPERQELEVWSGGHPPVLLLGAGHEPVGEINADQLPLGIVGAERFEAATRIVNLSEVEHILLCSDGLLEARNASGEMFGERAFREALDSGRTEASPLMEKLKRGLVGFLDGLEPHDDVSILTLNLGAARAAAPDAGSCA